jgi:hypothetical protein
MNREQTRYDDALITFEVRFEDDVAPPVTIDINTYDRFVEHLDKNNWKWTKLENMKCPCCRLNTCEVLRCPAAVSIASLLSNFNYNSSIQKVIITAIDQVHRCTEWNMNLQNALCILSRIAVFFSGCPVAEEIRPFISDLSPLATYKELYKHLILKLLVMFKSDKRQARCDIEKRLADLHIVDRYLASRVRSAVRGDAIPNSLVILDTQFLGLEMHFEDVYREIMNEMAEMKNTYYSQHIVQKSYSG